MKKTLYILIAVVVITLIVVLGKGGYNVDTTDNTLELGYIIYPPLLTRDAETGELSGISYDIVESIASDMGMETEWVEEVGWGTALEGLKTDRYDLLGTQMLPNEEREKAATFSDAPIFGALYPYIKTGNPKFTSDDLNRINSEDITITYLDGEIAMFMAQEDFPKAKTLALPQLSSFSEIVLGVIQDKADVVFIEAAVADDFLSLHPGSIEKLGDTPVKTFGNSFAFKKEDVEFLGEWNQSLKEMKESGKIKEILEKHEVQEYYLIK